MLLIMPATPYAMCIIAETAKIFWLEVGNTMPQSMATLESEIYDKLRSRSADWRILAYDLGFNQNDTKRIQEENSDVEVRLRAVCAEWVKRNPKGSLRDVDKALKKLRDSDEALNFGAPEKRRICHVFMCTAWCSLLLLTLVLAILVACLLLYFYYLHPSTEVILYEIHRPIPEPPSNYIHVHQRCNHIQKQYLPVPANSPLMIATMQGNVKMVELLLIEGATVTATNKDGITATDLVNYNLLIHFGYSLQNIEILRRYLTIKKLLFYYVTRKSRNYHKTILNKRTQKQAIHVQQIAPFMN